MNERLIILVKSFADKLGLSEIDVSVVENNGVYSVAVMSALTNDPIATDDERFNAFSHLIKRMAEKILGETAKISVDFNNKKQRQDDMLRTKAKIIAERAREFRKDMEMEPMSSYERMVVHSALEPVAYVTTESIGEGRNRRVVIHFQESTRPEESFNI